MASAPYSNASAAVAEVELRNRCGRWLNGHRPLRSMRESLLALAEIAALADSVYLSFYKGLGGLAGCVLAGPEDFIADLAPWQTRLAGYRARARALAVPLGREPGWRVAPEPPQVNAFQLHLPVAPEALREGMLAVARERGFWLGARAVASQVLAGGAMVEVVIGDAADGWGDDEAVAAWRAAVTAAR